jgi:hypothetical protein
MIRMILTATILTFGTIPAGIAQEKKEPATPPPLELKVTAKETKYTLDLGGQTSEDYRKRVNDAAKNGRPAPTPAVQITVELKNNSDKALKVWTSGDPVILTLSLKGKGALDLDPPLAFTEEFRSPNVTEIPAGKSHTITYTTLTSGFRGRAHFAYWSEPGEHQLTATLQTGVSPAPKGAKPGNDGFGIVTLTSKPLALTVEEKK